MERTENLSHHPTSPYLELIIRSCRGRRGRQGKPGGKGGQRPRTLPPCMLRAHMVRSPAPRPPALPRCLIALMLSLTVVYPYIRSHALSDTQCMNNVPLYLTHYSPHTLTYMHAMWSLSTLSQRPQHHPSPPHSTRTFETTRATLPPADKVQHSGSIRRRRSQCQQKLIHQQTHCSIPLDLCRLVMLEP